MKRLLFSIFIINIMLSFLFIINTKNNEISKNISELGRSNSFTINIQNDIDNLDKNIAIDKIEKVVKKYDGSINKKFYLWRTSNKTDIIQYVYLNNPADYLQTLDITGNLLVAYDDSLNMIGSNNSTNKNKIGVIETLKSDIAYEIYTFQGLKDSKKSLSGFYTVNISGDTSSDVFINQLSKELGVIVNKNFQNTTTSSSSFFFFEIIPIIFLNILATIIVLYSVFFRFKEIGVKKMLGYKTAAIGLEFIKGIAKVYLLSFILSYIIIVIYYFLNKSKILFDSIIFSLKIYSIIFIITIIILTIPLMFINSITISQAIKNQKPTGLINKINIFFKVSFTFTLIILLSIILNLYLPIKSFYQHNYKKWEEAKNYAYVPLSYMDINDTEEKNLLETKQMKDLYIWLNNKGAIEIYIPDEIKTENNKIEAIAKLNESEILEGEGYGFSKTLKLKIKNNGIRVNNNYLKLNHIYDMNGNIIQTGEDENIIYLLIPEKLQDQKEEIIKSYKYPYENNMFTLSFSRLHSKFPDLFAGESPEIKPIIVKNEQRYFTYDIDAFSASKNYIIDPIVEINNNKVEHAGDISKNRGLYIRISSLDNPFEDIKDQVEKLQLTAYYNNAFSIYNDVAESIYTYQTMLIKQSIAAATIILVLVLLIIYTGIIRMERKKIENSVKILNGYSFFTRHKSILLFSYILYMVPITFILLKKFDNIDKLVSMILGIWIIDLFITTTTIYLYEKRNLKDVIKGS